MKKLHKIEIKSVKEDLEVSTPQNTEVFLDGEPIRGLQSIKVELCADNNISLVTLKIASVIEGEFIVEELSSKILRQISVEELKKIERKD